MCARTFSPTAHLFCTRVGCRRAPFRSLPIRPYAARADVNSAHPFPSAHASQGGSFGCDAREPNDGFRAEASGVASQGARRAFMVSCFALWACGSEASPATIHICPRGEVAALKTRVDKQGLQARFLDQDSMPLGTNAAVSEAKDGAFVAGPAPAGAVALELGVWDQGELLARGVAFLGRADSCACFSAVHHYQAVCENMGCRFRDDQCVFVGSDGGEPTEQRLVVGENPSDLFRGRTQDTLIREDEPDQMFSAASRLSVDSDPFKVSLVHFDLSMLPSDAVVLGAAFSVATCGVAGDCDSSGSVALYEATERWDESASWRQKTALDAWSQPGCTGVCRSAQIASIPGPLVVSTSYSADVTRTVSGWVRQPDSNQGGFLLSVQGTNGVDFYASEAGEDGVAPRLEIRYRIP